MSNFGVKPDFCLLDLDEVGPNSLQPKFRITKERLRRLRHAISESLSLAAPLVVRTPNDPHFDYRIIDGHRRVEVARNEGVTQMWFQVLEGEPERMFILLNCGNLEFSDATWWSVWSNSKGRKRAQILSDEIFPPRVRRDISDLVNIYGSSSRVADMGRAGMMTPHFLLAPLRVLRAAAETIDNGRAHESVRLTNDEERVLIEEVYLSSQADNGKKNLVRKQIAQYSQNLADRIDPKNLPTWSNATSKAFRREVEKILSGAVRSGKAKVQLP